RDAVQDCGVWVFKRSFKQADIAGFSLSSSKHPLIYLNNGQAKTRQIFTLFHELGHLLFGAGHLGRTDPERYVELLYGEDRAVEIACNAFAGELLVPDDDFRRHAKPGVPDEETVAALAARYSVSREVILLDYRQRQWIDERVYDQRIAELRHGYPKASGSGGGDYYANQGAYLGAKYVTLAFSGYYRGDYDQDQLSEYLGLKAARVPGLENWLDSRALARQ
ncbi:MAG: ImmA/IrrE family metallo-endopeptidase, partial [Chloroflexota bacterium]|nr:ImmA/IrrE family metallo-endopeptidase [Chloroflexota bacterium]